MTNANTFINEAIDNLAPAADEIALSRYCDDTDIISAYLNDEPLPRYSRAFMDARRSVRTRRKADDSTACTDIRFNGKRWESFVQGEFIAAGPTPRSVQAAHDRALTAALRTAFDNL